MHIPFSERRGRRGGGGGLQPGAFQSICKLSTLMARQSHPVVTKHRGWHCLVCEEIVVPDRSNLSRSVGPLSSAASENKDHLALIAPSPSNRGIAPRGNTRSLRSLRSLPARPFFPPVSHLSCPCLQVDSVSPIGRDKPRKKIATVSRITPAGHSPG